MANKYLGKSTNEIDALVGKRVFGMNVIGEYRCFTCEGDTSVDINGDWRGSN